MIPGGGTINDGGARLDLQVRSDVSLSGLLQYEKWNIPILNPVVQSNWTTSVGLTFYPRNWGFQTRN